MVRKGSAVRVRKRAFPLSGPFESARSPVESRGALDRPDPERVAVGSAGRAGHRVAASVFSVVACVVVSQPPPVFNDDAQLIGGFSLFGFDGPLTADEIQRYVQTMLSAAEQLTRNTGGHMPLDPPLDR